MQAGECPAPARAGADRGDCEGAARLLAAKRL